MDSEKNLDNNIDAQEANLSIPDGFGAIWALQTSIYAVYIAKIQFVFTTPGFKNTIFIYTRVYIY